ncbi:MAG: hypothetical protein KC777_17775 [Cyanobacteria bacterium HKST-UBA02]|nr:hypothetical protein [Cyanobacteria bacterium HKST-UBA02]
MPHALISTQPKEKATHPEPVKTEQPRTLYFRLAALGGNPLLAITLLVVINLICYRESLGGYFLADDFIHVSYLQEVFNGKAYLLLENFRTAWLQSEGTSFYRPLISFTLALDYLLWGPNPFGFHLSNLFYQCLASIGLYLLYRRLFIADLDPERQVKLSPDHTYTLNIGALLAACIFAAHPLHPEVATWIIGRVDSVCAVFYIFSFWLFLKSIQSKIARPGLAWLRALSLVFFAMALLSKEMAVTLPASMALLLMIFFPRASEESRSLIKNIVRAFRLTWQYWLILGIYLMVRSLALGSLLGGYQGSLSLSPDATGGMVESLFERILSEQSVYRIMFPLNQEVFAGNNFYLDCLRVLLGLSLISFVLNLLLSRSKPTILKAICFSGFWFALVMLPTIPVFNITQTLQSSRFIYLGTAPLAMLLALAICPLARRGRRSVKGHGRTELTLRISQDFLKGLTSVLSILLIILLISITRLNNAPWIHASEEVRQLRDQLSATVGKLPRESSLALLNLPDRFMGSHILYNGSTLALLMQPPLTSPDLSSRIVTFEPALYGDNDLLRPARLKKIVRDPESFALYQWDRKQLRLAPLELDPTERQWRCPLEVSTTGGGAASLTVLPAADLSALGGDLLVLEFEEPAHLPAHLFVRFNTREDQVFDNERIFAAESSDRKKVVIPVTEHKLWLGASHIHRLAISDSGRALPLRSVSILPASGLMPKLDLSAPAGVQGVDNRGIINIDRGVESLRLAYDASTIPNASSVVIQISKPNSFWEHSEGSYLADRLRDDALVTLKAAALKNDSYDLSLSAMKESGFYEVRLISVSGDGKVTGYFSEPLFLQIGKGGR